MLPEPRAVVFDLDDTLYPYRRFVRSGFGAVAAYLSRTRRVDRTLALKALIRASRGRDRGVELQACMAQCGLPMSLLPVLIGVLTHHQPTLTLSEATVDVLRTLRAAGFRLGVLTNGPRAVQARKVSALGVARYVDTVVYATEHGTGAGKPERQPFVEVLRRLGVPPAAAVFVGDDEVCDIGGARQAGFMTVHCTTWRRATSVPAADAVVSRLAMLPALIPALLEEARNRHAA